MADIVPDRKQDAAKQDVAIDELPFDVEAIIEQAPPELQPQLRMAFHMQVVSGPLPSASEMAGYKEIMPDLPGRITTMAESQAKHRQHLELVVISGDNFRANVGLFMAYSIVLLFFGLAVYLIIIGQPGWGVGLLSVDLAALVVVFITGSAARAAQLRGKADQQKKPKTLRPE